MTEKSFVIPKNRRGGYYPPAWFNVRNRADDIRPYEIRFFCIKPFFIMHETKGEINMTEKPFVIQKKNNTNYQTISIRIQEDTFQKIEQLSTESNHSRNHLINILLEYAVDQIEISPT